MKITSWVALPLIRNTYSLLLGASSAAAAVAKSLQSCPTLCNPIDGSPPGSSVRGIFQARVLEWGAIAFSKRSLSGCNKMIFKDQGWFC